MQHDFLAEMRRQLAELRAAGLEKGERVIASPQGAELQLANGTAVLNFCANNYLGLASHPALVASAREALTHRGFGMASVRFICGTQDVHRELELRLARFLGLEDAILYGSCFDANGGLFETLLDERDAVISDALNHASIIDGVRLGKSRRLRYANNDMVELESRLREASDAGARFKLVATDGVFSMDGVIANLSAICHLAHRHGALVMVDDSHGVGVLGARGRGTHEHCGVMDRVDLVTGTLGKALGGASGGYTAGRREVIALLRNRSRPYLFSNALMPAIAAASLTALELLEKDDSLRARLAQNAARLRRDLARLGFTLAGADHPIIPVMLGDVALAGSMSDRLLAEGIYAVAFSYPVVPRGSARIRLQVSAAHKPRHLERAVAAFAKVGRELGVIRG